MKATSINATKDLDFSTIKCGSCLNCGKQVTNAYYGRFQNGGVCSKDCNISYLTKLKERFDVKDLANFSWADKLPNASK